MKKIDYKWVMLILVSFAYFLAQGARNVYGAVLPSISAELGLTKASSGTIASTFFMVFGLMIPFAGFFADFFRRKWMIVIGMTIFSLATIGTGFANSMMMLLIFYGIVNACGQSLMPPSNSSLIGQLHVETRARAFAIYQTIFYIGIVVCCCAGGKLAMLGTGGWRHAFQYIGLAGMALVLVLIFFLRDTPQPVSDNGTVEKAKISDGILAFFKKPTAILLMIALGFYFYSTNGFKTWSVTFLEKAMNQTHESASFHGTFWFYIGAIAGVQSAGYISDRLKSLREGIRLETNIAGLLLMIPFILIASYTNNMVVMCVSIFFFGFSTGVYDSNLYAALLDVVNPRYRAAAIGIFGCGGCLLGAPGPAIQGIMINSFGDRHSMAFLAIFSLLGAAIILIARAATFRHDKV